MFRTELPLTPHPQQLPLSARVLTIGSCFSDSIGTRLRDFKVATMANPFGTVFNPLSACRLLRAAAGEDMDWQQHVVEARGRWQSYDLHAEIGAETPVELLQHIQTLTREVGVFLATADAVVLTLGSAFAYRLRETDEIISNCHKLPADKFDKELLTADEIIAAVAETHAYLRRINPRLRFILTVSPVRHLKDTLVLNSASKSMLRVACHYLSELLPDVTYFPAYELLLDDLRDYRFYAADMLHLSEVAENYIWERFTRTYFDAAFGRFKKEWEGIRQALGHRPTYAAAPEHRQFLEGTLERLRRLSQQADVRMEQLHLERELAALPLPPPPAEPEPEEDDDEERIDIGDYAEEPLSTATLVGPGAGVLVEESTEEDADEISESPDTAYEQAYAASLADNEESDIEEDIATSEDDEPVRRKKRRSRGGAKRTKRKHARLAAEAAAAEATAEQTVSSTEVIAEPTEEHFQAAELTPEVVTPSSTLEDTDAPEAAEQDEPTRRSRNNRRNRRERPPRSGSRTNRPALYATESATPSEAENQELSTSPAINQSHPDSQASDTPEAPSAFQPELQATEATALPETEATEPQLSRPKRAATSRNRNRKKNTEPASAPELETPAAEAPAAQAAVILPDVPVEAPLEAALPVPKTRARRKPTPKTANPEPVAVADAAAEAPAEAPTEIPTDTPASKPARKRPSRKPKAAEPEAPSTDAASSDAPAETLAEAPVAPKRKPRPPRRKPAPDAPTPENS